MSLFSIYTITTQEEAMHEIGKGGKRQNVYKYTLNRLDSWYITLHITQFYLLSYSSLTLAIFYYYHEVKRSPRLCHCCCSPDCHSRSAWWSSILWRKANKQPSYQRCLRVNFEHDYHFGDDALKLDRVVFV